MSAVFRAGPLRVRTALLDTVFPTSLPVPTMTVPMLTDGPSISHDLMMLLHAAEGKGEEGRAVGRSTCGEEACEALSLVVFY